MTAATFLMLALSAGQQVPTVTLDAADARTREGFTSIFAVHELPDGRVLMTDNLDRAIRLADLRAGTVRDLGRHGGGPLEYQSAHTILRGAGDTVLVTDNNQRRFVTLVNGAIVGTAVQPDILRRLSSFSAPLTDARGRLHFDVRNLEMGDAGFIEHDGHVIRWSPGASRLDTVATIRVAHRAPRRNAGYNPFVYRSAWGLAADGAIALVHAEPYHVEWIVDGRIVRGPEIAYERVALDAAERDAERDAFTTRGRGSISTNAPATRGSRDPAIRASIPDNVFPPHKPPFTESRVLVSPAGEVWIPRAGRWDAASTLVDVVGRDGRLRRQVRLPAARRVVGFGSDVVYVAVKDQFDLHRLERIPLRP